MFSPTNITAYIPGADGAVSFTATSGEVRFIAPELAYRVDSLVRGREVVLTKQ